jgi:hypothetical protein
MRNKMIRERLAAYIKSVAVGEQSALKASEIAFGTMQLNGWEYSIRFGYRVVDQLFELPKHDRSICKTGDDHFYYDLTKTLGRRN